MLRVFDRVTKTEDEINQLTRMSNKIILLTHENKVLKTENNRLNQIIIKVTTRLKKAILS
jgi:regulator of replication initiation timing